VAFGALDAPNWPQGAGFPIGVGLALNLLGGVLFADAVSARRQRQAWRELHAEYAASPDLFVVRRGVDPIPDEPPADRKLEAFVQGCTSGCVAEDADEAQCTSMCSCISQRLLVGRSSADVSELVRAVNREDPEAMETVRAVALSCVEPATERP